MGSAVITKPLVAKCHQAHQAPGTSLGEYIYSGAFWALSMFNFITGA